MAKKKPVRAVRALDQKEEFVASWMEARGYQVLRQCNEILDEGYYDTRSVKYPVERFAFAALRPTVKEVFLVDVYEVNDFDAMSVRDRIDWMNTAEYFFENPPCYLRELLAGMKVIDASEVESWTVKRVLASLAPLRTESGLKLNPLPNPRYIPDGFEFWDGVDLGLEPEVAAELLSSE